MKMLNHKGTKQIETERLLLRRVRMDDAQAMFDNWASDTEVSKYLTWPTHANVGVTKMVIGSWIENYTNEDYYQWAIVLKGEGDKPVGTISVVHQDDRIGKAEIGYCIGRNWWHKGIMSEALKAVMNYLFDEVGMNRVEARHDPRNPHSGAVMRKCGMKYEGTARQADWNNQGICDVCIYALLEEER